MTRIDIDKIKRVIQGNSRYMRAIKFVTSEDARTVLESIKKDLMIFKDVERIIIEKDTIELTRENATIYTYYFTDAEVFAEVLDGLDAFEVRILKLNDK